MSKKPVIVFEGIEGSGKTFYINLISNYLKKKRISYIKFREPGGSKNSEKIRNLILSNKNNFKPIFPDLKFCGDNAAMIAMVGLEKFKSKQFDTLDLPANPRFPLDENAKFLKGAGTVLD